MKTEDALRVFGTKTAIAAELSLSVAAVSGWGEFVPEKNAPHLAAARPGELVYDRNLYIRIREKQRERREGHYANCR